MLWDLIRDFFVQHVFGGVDSNGIEYSIKGGLFLYFDKGEWIEESANFNGLLYQINKSGDGQHYFIGASDWLSTTATAISITIIVVLCCLFVYKIIKLIGGLIR